MKESKACAPNQLMNIPSRKRNQDSLPEPPLAQDVERPVIEELRDLLDSGEPLFDKSRSGYHSEHVDATLRTLLDEYDNGTEALAMRLRDVQTELAASKSQPAVIPAAPVADNSAALQQSKAQIAELENQLQLTQAKIAALESELEQAAAPLADAEDPGHLAQIKESNERLEELTDYGIKLGQWMRDTTYAFSSEQQSLLNAARLQARNTATAAEEKAKQMVSEAKVEAETIKSRARAELN
jgi:cell division septum initiation protein DivIVA